MAAARLARTAFVGAAVRPVVAWPRLAGWIAFELDRGDEIELIADPDLVWRARVVRVLGGGEYGVHFLDLAPDVKRRIIETVGLARAGHVRWAVD